ncbi:MAG: GGDEF domain-containing protein [Magnetococcales bacterium]|nr:GGDEF domain-containing protein [Magnetococcales bacterium]
MAKIDEQRLAQIYQGPEYSLLSRIGELLREILPGVADRFYADMIQREEARYFLDSQIIEQRLKQSMLGWIAALFEPHAPEQMEELFARQRLIGEVHARINIPMHLVVEGMRIIRREISNGLSSQEIERNLLVEMVVLINEVLDHTLSLINESYVINSVAHERNVQALRLLIPPQAQALECQRMRVVLRDWLRQLWKLRAGDGSDGEVIALGRAEFGLWVFHKAPLFFSSPEVVGGMWEGVQQADALMGRLVLGVEQAALIPYWRMRDIEQAVNAIELQLVMLTEEVLEQDKGRDPLTRVFNRRFLDTVASHEISISMKHHIPFALLLCDIDHFKRINDQHGHDAGDAVLRKFAEILFCNIRANDYIFRFGGEEFLILFGDMNEGRLERLAEKFRAAVEETLFPLPNGQTLRITSSFGGAIHDGHPDYMRTLKRADQALYEAKGGGRNRYVLAPLR